MSDGHAAAAPPAGRDADLVRSLRDGDEAAFRQLVLNWSPPMLRIARTYVGTWAAAEDVVQDTWLAVVRGLPRFEQRSSLRTWALSILANRARTRAARDHAVVAWSQLPHQGEEGGADPVEPGRFRGPDDPYPGHWAPGAAPTPWREHPEGAALSREAVQVLQHALEALPTRQQTVVRLRDLHDLSSQEVCEALGISAENQRVLLHRGRTRLRAELERHYSAEPA